MIRTYKFGALPPTKNAAAVHDQMRRGHVYQNKLVEIEIWRRKELRLLDTEFGDTRELEQTLDAVKAEIEKLDRQIKGMNAKARKKVAPKDLRQALADKKVLRKKLNGELIAKRKGLRDNNDLKIRKDALSDAAASKVREVRKNKDIVPWYGTYMLIEKAMIQTNSMPLYDFNEPNDPRFKRFNGEGRVGIEQVQDSGSLPKLIDTMIGINPTHTMIQILPMPAPSPRKDGRARKIGNKDLRLLRIKVCTAINENGKKETVWAEFPINYHRPIPPGSKVLTAQVVRRFEGPKECWSVSLSVDEPVRENETDANDNASLPAIAFDMGWRWFDDRIRVAKSKDSNGNRGEIAVPLDLVDSIRKGEEIRSIRDKEFDAIRAKLTEWLVSSECILPEWLKEKTQHIDKWKSQKRMVSLIKHWSDNRFAGDEAIFGISGRWNKQTKCVIDGTGLAGWRYHDYHLWTWQSSQVKKSERRRNEFYKCEAAKIGAQYKAVVFENINLANMAKGKVGSTNRQLTAPSEFMGACKNSMQMRRKQHLKVPAHNTSTDCSNCGHRNDIGGKLEYSCEGCKQAIERDDNACDNILERGLEALGERPSDAQNAEVARMNDFNGLEPISTEQTEVIQLE